MEKLWNKYDNHNLNEGLTLRRREKLKFVFNVMIRGFNPETADRSTIEKFINKLNKNEFKKLDGSYYAGSVKQDVKKFIKQFFKWYKGENEYYPKEVSWIKTKIPKDEKVKERPIIEKKQVPQLAKMFKAFDYQMAVLLQFDSGFRIQELMSVKKQDLTWEEFDDSGEKCFWIKCNESKTFPRKIPVPLFTGDIKAYFNSMDYQSKADDEPLLKISYAYYTNKLKEYSSMLLGKNRVLTSHCLRHSSATYYAREYNGNVPLLAQRYGWSFDAKELKTYVRASGAYNKQGAKISYSNEMSKLKQELDRTREQLDNLVEWKIKTNEALKIIKKKYKIIPK